MRRATVAFALMGILIILSGNFLPMNVSEAPYEIKLSQHINLKFVLHNVIKINNESEFAELAQQEGWLGDGTADNPYIIENYEIDAHDKENCIYIGNTTLHFIIRNCKLYNASSDLPYMGAGIYLYNVSNAVLSNNICTENKYGIYLNMIADCVVSGNNCSNNRKYGIFIVGGMNNKITGNICSDNKKGIYQMASTKSKIINNICSDNEVGICLQYTDNNKLYGNKMHNCGLFLDGDMPTMTSQEIPKNNTVNGKPIYYYKNRNMNNARVPVNAGQVILANVSHLIVENLNLSYASVGIEICFSSHITVKNCICSHNEICGIYIFNSSHNTISNNVCSYNKEGIGLTMFSSYNHITYNNISYNEYFGIFIDLYCSNNLIWGNSFYYNYGSGDTFNYSHVQAFDKGNNNHWYSSLCIGNYWHDWANNNNTNDRNHDGIVDWPYPIWGSEEAKDYYPLTEPIEISQTSGWNYVAIILIIIILVISLCGYFVYRKISKSRNTNAKK